MGYVEDPLCPPFRAASSSAGRRMGKSMRSRCSRIFERASGHALGPRRRHWYGVAGPKYNSRHKRLSVKNSFPVIIHQHHSSGVKNGGY